MSTLDLSIAVYLFVVMGVLGLLSVISYNKQRSRGDLENDAEE